MADLKNTEINDNLELPSGTTGERPASPQEGQIRYNTDLETVDFYNGSNWRPLSDTHPEATGGTVVDTDIGGVPYRIHYFTETGTDTLTVTNPGEVEYLIVAGGGGAGGNDSFSTYGHGGAGAGGLVQGVTSLSTGSFNVIVGAGGSGVNARELAEKGENSEFASIIALGGGPSNGDASNTDVSQLSGGSGAGQGNRGGTGGNATQPGSASGGFGNKGGDGSTGNDRNTVGAGGGGAGAPGNNAGENPTGNQGNGGAGILSLISGTAMLYAGGGGGGGQSVRGGAGGIGGGGNGASNGEPPLDAATNTGGGAGGGTSEFGGGNGGSGIVIIRYPRNSSLDSQPDRTTIATQPQNFQTVRDGLVLELDAGNPVSYSGSGNQSNDIVGNRIGTLQNGISYNDSNQGSFVFDGTNQYITFGYDSSGFLDRGQDNVQITIEAWVNPNAFNNNQAIWQIGGYINSAVLGIMSNGDARFAVRKSTSGTGVPLVDSDVVLNLNEWVHLVGSKTSSQMTLYVNAEQNQQIETTYTWNTGGNTPNWVGRVNSQSGLTGQQSRQDPFNGEISNVKIYDRGLSEAEVQQNFNALRGRFGV